MADHLPPAPPEAMPPVEWDGRVSLPARWSYDDFGMMRIPAHEWDGRDNRIWWCNGQQYHWNGVFMEPWNQPVERQWDGTCVKPGTGYPKTRPERTVTVVGSLGWTLPWAFFLGVPSLVMSGVLVGAVPPPPNGTTHGQDHAAVAVTVAFWVAVWFGIHQFRRGRCRS